MVLCAVTRRLTLIHDHRSATEEQHKADMEATFPAIMDAAHATSTFMNLSPLSEEGRSRYLVELLKERHGYLGDAADVPSTLVESLSQRAAGHPKFIEELLGEMVKAKVVTVVHSDGHGSRIKVRSFDHLGRVPPPPSTEATLLQVFDCLPAPLQSVLAKVSPLDCFSEGVLAALGLPAAVMERATHLLARAVRRACQEERPALLEAKSADLAPPWRGAGAIH